LSAPRPDSFLNAAALSAPGETPEADVDAPDEDNVQAGDQTTSDTAAEAAGEQAGVEAPGNDGPVGPADEPSNASVDHER
jgi:hypothetical protein